ncbi:hypothetical protein ACFQH9_03955 [Pseudonocardia lutea]|uniref:Uncharacterized protein n=1 Tax=Pseudonocardia lutea TaxID=2172015 RepID=A0ABW1I2T7_9PSEU
MADEERPTDQQIRAAMCEAVRAQITTDGDRDAKKLAARPILEEFERAHGAAGLLRLTERLFVQTMELHARAAAAGAPWPPRREGGAAATRHDGGVE